MRKYSNEDWQLQIENCPKHISKMTLKYFKEKKVNLLEWHPYSPDLSPIKTFGNIVRTVKQKDINTQADLILEIERHASD